MSATAAQAQTVENTVLQPVASRGAGTATTTTTATGTTTTVTGPGGDANRSYATPVANTWHQSAVGGGGTVGITTDYARDGNGSAYFSTTSGDSKGDLQFYFAAPVALSALQSVSYDYYRAASSTNNPIQAPALRFDILKNGGFAGSLVLEAYYQGEVNAATNTWTTVSATLNTGDIWATNSALGPTFATAGGEKSFQQWIADNAGSTLTVRGLSIGAGSGWNGTFAGAIDNVAYSFAGGPTADFNFEVASGATAAVPEPTSWAMMIGGFGIVGGTMRRRRKTTVAFA